MKSNVAQIKKSDTISGPQHQNAAVAQAVSKALANTYMLYLKTQNFHWNVEGARFVAVHTLTEKQYQEMQIAIDEIAERIRALGYYAPGSFRDFSKSATIQEAPPMPITEQEMIEVLAADHLAMIACLVEAIEVSEKNGDTTTTDILSNRRQFHEQAAWMLRSLAK